jgi:hypothetical protein
MGNAPAAIVHRPWSRRPVDDWLSRLVEKNTI